MKVGDAAYDFAAPFAFWTAGRPARDNPNRENVAESLGPYLAARLRPDRIDQNTRQTIEDTIPNRTLYFDCLGLSMQVLE